MMVRGENVGSMEENTSDISGLLDDPLGENVGSAAETVDDIFSYELQEQETYGPAAAVSPRSRPGVAKREDVSPGAALLGVAGGVLLFRVLVRRRQSAEA